MRSMRRNSIRLTSALILGALFFVGIRAIHQRAYSYSYNPKLDYQYRFNPEFTSTFETTINDNTLDVSDIPEDFTTAFAEVEIKSNLNGLFLQPEIQMNSGNISVFQNLECRAKGIRYLNISQFVQQGNKVVKLEMKGCKLTNRNIKVIAWKNSDPAKAKIMIIAPHPDDAEIAAYGLYASNPENSFIATITAGDAGSMRYREWYADSVQHYIAKGKIRVWNSITVPHLGGIAPNHCINLGYFDASLKKMHADTTAHGFSRYIKTDDIQLFRSDNCPALPDSLQPESNWRSLVNDLKNLLLKEQPSAIVSIYPALDYHFDHKFSTVALLQAMQELKYDSCQLWLYTNHYPMTKMYPDGKIGSQTTVPPYFENTSIYFDQLLSFSLSKKLQSDKAMALDAMNDLRPETQYRSTIESWQQTKKNFWDKLYLKESDYFRRSVRSNELFFVIEGKNALQPDIQSKIFGEL